MPIDFISNLTCRDMEDYCGMRPTITVANQGMDVRPLTCMTAL